MFDNINMTYDAKNQVYTFKGMFGVNFRGYILQSVLGQKKTDIIFRKLSFNEIVIDSFFLLELIEVCKYILDGEGPYSSWLNVKSIKKLHDLIMTETWMNPDEYGFKSKFTLNMDLMDKVFKFKPLPDQEKIYPDYENFKNNLGYNGMLFDVATGVGKTFLSLSLSVAIEAEVVVIIAMNIAVEPIWKKTLLDEKMWEDKYIPKESDIYTASDFYNKKPYTNQKYIIFNYEAIGKLIDISGRIAHNKVSLIVDEVHSFTSMDSKRQKELLILSANLKTEDIFLLSGTPIKASTLELIIYLQLIDPKFTDTVERRFRKAYGSPNYVLKRCTPIRYGMMVTRIEKNLPPVEYKTLDIKLKNGDEFTLSSIKKDMISYIDMRTKEIDNNLPKYKNIYNELLFKAKINSNLPEAAWIEYMQNFNLVCEYYIKRQLMFHGDIIKLVNDFEKVIILNNLKGDEKKQFKEASVVLKYPMLKIRGEVLGIVVLGARIKCHKEMAENIDYSILNSTSGKAIIMTSYIEIAEAATVKLIKQDFNPVGIYGEKTKDSNSTVDSFINNENVNPLVGTYKSISTALHLVVANMIVLLDLPFRTYMLDQSVARVHRNGQTRQVIIIYTRLDTGDEYNINSRNIDILKWAKDIVEEITGNDIKGLDFEKGKAIEAIEGMESETKDKEYDCGLEDDDVMTQITINFKDETNNKLLNW